MGTVYYPSEDDVAKYLVGQKLNFIGENPINGSGKRVDNEGSSYNIKLMSASVNFIPRIDVIMYYPVQEIIITLPQHSMRIKTQEESSLKNWFSWEFSFGPVEFSFTMNLQEYEKDFHAARERIAKMVNQKLNEELNTILAGEISNSDGRWRLFANPVDAVFKWQSALVI